MLAVTGGERLPGLQMRPRRRAIGPRRSLSRVKSDPARWARVVKAANVQAE